MAVRESRPIPSDATLVWLASERAAPLFRTLDRTRAFGPLVVVLAVLPAVLGSFAEVITAEDAAWGLRALDATGSPLPAEAVPAVAAVIPDEAVRPIALQLSAWMMRLLDPARPAAIAMASLMGGAALLGLLWPLARSLADRRFAFWAVLIAAFHPTVADLLSYPVPITVGIALSLAALWGHLNLHRRSLQAALIWIGIVASLVGALLLIGLAAAMVACLIAVDAIFALVLAGRDRRQHEEKKRPLRGMASPRETAVRRLSAVLAGVAVWAAIDPFVPAHLTASAGAELLDVDVERFVQATRAAEAAAVGPLWGLAAIGLIRLLRILSRRAAARSPYPIPRLLLTWVFAASGAVLWTGGPTDGAFDPDGEYLQALLSLSLLLAAVYGIEEAARRSVSGAWVLLAVALPLAVRLGGFLAALQTDEVALWVVLLLTAGFAAWGIARALPALAPVPGLRRGLLMGAVLLAIGINVADGFAVLFQHPDDHAYRRLISQLSSGRRAEAAVLLTDLTPPPELTFAIRASLPHAAMGIARTWDEAAAELDRRLEHAVRSAVVVAWGPRGAAAATAAEDLRPTGQAQLFAGRELLPYAYGEL